MMSQNKGQKKLIGELLVQEGIVEARHVEEALEEQKKSGGKLVQILLSKGYLKLEDFEHFLARQPGIASIEIQNYVVQDALLRLIPATFARAHEVFPLDKLGNLLTVGMACPLDSRTIQEIEKMTNLRVRALLCNATDIRAMIAKYYGTSEGESQEEEIYDYGRAYQTVSHAIRLEGVADLVRRIDTLPSLPTTVRRLQEAVANPDVSIEEVTEIVGSDPLVAAKLLRVVNSAAFGLVQRVEALTHAVMLVGLKEIYMIVLSAAVPDLFKEGKGLDYRRLWQDSVGAASVCVALAETAGVRRTAVFFTAGLLHDIGKAALAQAAPERYKKVDPTLADEALLKAEEEILGVTHPEAGYVLASNWGFPGELAEAIRFHHHPERATTAKRLAAFTAAGSSLAYAIIHNDTESWMRRYAGLLSELGIAHFDLQKVVGRANAAMEPEP
ncbi:MAG TPA: HDOD domain-containing protein [Candidatus Hydrogenedentes bacterium]|nr:HDOD domain-containing protein [Candidatus Hydrogenedentota bacterium]HOL76761.1 HDOD domain-containing protein [Candidatus Hydrogenedentota bacterium]